MKFDGKMRPVVRKKRISQILTENRAPAPLKKGISQNPSIFLIVDLKTRCKPKIVTLDQEVRHLLRKNKFQKFSPKIFTENQAPPPKNMNFAKSFYRPPCGP